MPASTEPRSGIFYGWSLGESGWNAQMNTNLQRIGQVGFHLSVKDRNLTAPPASPVAGDSYIVGVSATDAWAGKDNNVTIWSGSAWLFEAPRVGWVAYIEDEEKLSVFKTAGWSAGVAI